MKIYQVVLLILALALVGCQTQATVVEEQPNPQVAVLETEAQVQTKVFYEVVTIEDEKIDIDSVVVPLNTNAEITFINANDKNESSVRLVSQNTDVFLRAREQYTLSLPAQTEASSVYFEIGNRMGTIEFR